VFTIGVLPRDLFPSFSQGEFFFDIRVAEGTALHVTDATLVRLANTVVDDPDVRWVYTSCGQTDLAAFSGGAREPSRGQISVVLRQGAGKAVEDRLTTRLREALAGRRCSPSRIRSRSRSTATTSTRCARWPSR
jgi:multidrug efflux pump subunit AcrB